MKGIDFLVRTIHNSLMEYKKDSMEWHITKIDRCMMVLQDVSWCLFLVALFIFPFLLQLSLEDIENQEYIVNFNKHEFLMLSDALLRLFHGKIGDQSEGQLVYTRAFFSILRVLINITSDKGKLSFLVWIDSQSSFHLKEEPCQVFDHYFLMPAHLLLRTSLFQDQSLIVPDQRFDRMVIILCLIINLVSCCPRVRSIVMMDVYVGRLCDLLFNKIDQAAQAEEQTDQMLQSHESVPMTRASHDRLLDQSE